MENKRISVIIPAYNAEKTIKTCINSLLKQTFNKFEIIIIDDGSKDNTLKIATKLVEKNPNKVKVLHQENQGVSNARNLGIKNAHTDYITFLDADDYVEQNYLETLIMPFYDRKIQLSICGYIKENEKTLYKCHYLKTGYVNVESLYEQILINNDIEGYAVNKLYNLNLIKKNSIFFDSKVKIGEDLLFNIRYLAFVKNIFICELPVYHYIMNEKSATNRTKMGKKFDQNTLTILDALNEIINLIPSNLSKARNDAKAQLGNNASNILRIIYLSKNKKDLKPIISKLKIIVKENFKYVLLTNIFSIKTKVKYIINIISPRFTVLLWKISRIKNRIGR